MHRGTSENRRDGDIRRTTIVRTDTIGVRAVSAQRTSGRGISEVRHHAICERRHDRDESGGNGNVRAGDLADRTIIVTSVMTSCSSPIRILTKIRTASCFGSRRTGILP